MNFLILIKQIEYCVKFARPALAGRRVRSILPEQSNDAINNEQVIRIQIKDVMLNKVSFAKWITLMCGIVLHICSCCLNKYFCRGRKINKYYFPPFFPAEMDGQKPQKLSVFWGLLLKILQTFNISWLKLALEIWGKNYQSLSLEIPEF